MPNNILITGPPRSGKTTLIKRIAQESKYLLPEGFYTEEIKVKGSRVGFELMGLDGRKGTLSHVDIPSSFRVGKYRVDVSGFEVFLNSIDFFAPEIKLIIIDEIGKMECFSKIFNRLILQILDSQKLAIATIALRGSGLIAEIKKRHDIELFEIIPSSREKLFKTIMETLP